MLISVSLILCVGLLFGWLCNKARLPSLFGMILGGILIGPHLLNLIDESVLSASPELRRIALIIILLRAGLKLNFSDLRKVGRPAVLMCFLPASFELVGMVLLAPMLLGLSALDAAILGAVIAAVSPAVVVPRMIRLMDENCGTEKAIPQLILAGASVDDVFVIVLFTTFTGLASGADFSATRFINIPISIVTGILAGVAVGCLMALWFRRCHMRDTIKIMLLLSVSFAFVSAEDAFSGTIPFASLIAVMCIGAALKQKREVVAARLSERFDKLWAVAEIFLFVLVGASVSVESAASAGLSAVLLLLGALAFRMVGVAACLLGTQLDAKERLFCMIAYTPKATVQAAIGGLPLAMGLPCGEIVLTVSVIAILLTAPLGAFGIDLTYQQLLSKAN